MKFYIKQNYDELLQMFIKLTLKIAEQITSSQLMKLIFKGRVSDGKYEQLCTFIPNTCLLGDNGKQVPSSSIN